MDKNPSSRGDSQADEHKKSSIPPWLNDSRKRDKTNESLTSPEKLLVLPSGSSNKQLEWLASDKVGQELLDHGFEEHLGYRTTDVTIKGIEAENLCVYKNERNGTYYITTRDKANGYDKNGCKLQTIDDTLITKLVNAINGLHGKVEWDLPKIHAIRTADNQCDTGLKEEADANGKGKPRLRPKVLITDSEKYVRQKIRKEKDFTTNTDIATDQSNTEQPTENRKKGWRAVLPNAKTEIEISSDKEDSKKDNGSLSKEEKERQELIYKVFHGEIPKDKIDGSQSLQRISKVVEKHKQDLNELEGKVLELYYYTSDQDVRKKCIEQYRNYLKYIDEEINNNANKDQQQPDNTKSGEYKLQERKFILNELNTILEVNKNRHKVLEDSIHSAVEDQLSQLGFSNEPQGSGKKKIYIKGDLYSPKEGNGNYLLTDKKPDQGLVPVDYSKQSEKIEPSKIQCDLKVYVICKYDKSNDNKVQETLITDDRHLVENKVKKGWKVLPGKESGIELRSDNSGPSKQSHVETTETSGQSGGSGKDSGDANNDINKYKDYFLHKFNKDLEERIKYRLNLNNMKVEMKIGGINLFKAIDRIYITNGEYLPGCDGMKPEKLNTISLEALMQRLKENEIAEAPDRWYFPKLYVTKLGEVNDGQDGDLHIVVTDKETENPLATIDTSRPNERWTTVNRISNEICKIEYKKIYLENLRIKSSSEGYKRAMGQFWEHFEELDYKLSQSQESEKFRSSLQDDIKREWTDKLDRVKKILSNDEYDTNKDLVKDMAAITTKELINSNEEIDENNVYKYYEKATYEKLAEIGHISKDNVEKMYKQFKKAQGYENNKNDKNDVENGETITISELKGKGKEIIDVPGRGYYRFIYALLMSYNSKLTPDHKMKPDQIESLADETREFLVNGGVAREGELLKAADSQYDPQGDRYKLVLHEQVMYAIAFLRSKNIGVDRGLTVYANRSDDRDSDRRMAPIKVLEVEGNNDPLEVYLSGSHFQAVCKKDNGSTS